MSTPIEQTVSCIIHEIDKFLKNPCASRVTVPLMLDSVTVSPLMLNALYEHYKSRFADEDLYLFVSKPRARAEALEINKQVVIYDADGKLTSPMMLRGDTVLMYVVDSQFEDYRSKFLDRTMAATLATARHAGFAGLIHKHGEQDGMQS